jgi:hypothetical protein
MMTDEKKPQRSKQLKRDAVRLLRRYDAMRKEFAALERETNKACAEYGVSTGRWGFRPDHLRMEVELEKEKADA